MTRIADNVLDVTQFYAYASREDTLDYAKETLTQEILERFEKDEDAFTVTDHGYYGKCNQYPVSDDRRNRGNFPACRRNWNYEYYAGFCDGADAGNRHPQGSGSQNKGCTGAVFDGIRYFVRMRRDNRGDPGGGNCVPGRTDFENAGGD